MKNKIIYLILTFLMVFTYSKIYAQPGKVPSFKIVESNGKIFKAENLPIGKPLIIIYFSPECDDCQRLTENFLTRINDFKNVAVVMITYLSVESVRNLLPEIT